MAKRDKLYTVNKWNKPFFEEERRKKLYDGGGRRPIWGLNENQGLTRAGIAFAPEGAGVKLDLPGYYGSHGSAVSNPWRDMVTVYAAPPTENSTPSGDSNQQNVASASNNSKLRMIQDAAIAARDFAEGFKPITKLANLNEPISKPTPVASASSTGLFSNTGFGPKTTVFTETPYTTNTSTIFNNALNPRSLSQNVISPKTTSYVLNGADGFANANNDFQKVIGSYLQTNPQSDFAKYLTLDDMANSKIALPSLIEGYTPKIKGSGISDLSKAGIGIGASVLGEVGGNVISDGFSTTPGTLINLIGSTAGSVVSMIPGVGWWVGPAITLGSKLLGGVYNKAFGSEYKDNGASAYTNQLNALNPNGSNEYLANLLANTGSGPRATSRNGWFNHSAERRANKTNTAQDLALNRFRRGIKNAFDNNNWNQLQYALNHYNVTAMGGKLNKCKCNKKSYGGYLDSASPTGFNFLSDLTNIQMQKNQNQGGTATSVGNSFMNTPDMGITFAKGGIMIKPENRGKLTRLKKRTGKTEAELYNDGNPEHKKMVVFARNSRRWNKHAFGGKLNYGEDKDIRNNSLFNGASLYDLGGILQAGGSNWGHVTEINEGGTHELSPYDGVQVGVDPEGTPNLVEEGEVIWNDYVFSNRITVPKEVCKRLRIGQKKNGYTFADAAKKLLVESKERPNDPISKNGLEANMQLLEDAQEEVKRKMEAEQAIEQFNSLPPEQQVAIMNQEGERAQDAVTQEQMAQEIQNMPPEQQQAIAQQMMAEQAAAQGLGMPQGQPSPEEQAMMQQQMAQQQGINPQEAIAQASAMQQQALAGMALGGKLCFGGRLFAEGGELNGEQPVEQPDNEMAKYSDEELQDMIDDYQEAESGEVKVTKGKLARLKKKAEKAEAELERRHADENEEQSQEARQEPSQEELQAAAQAQAMQTQQPIEEQPQESMSPEQAMMMQQQMGGQPLISPEEMAAMELQQQGSGQYAYGGRLYPEGGVLGKYTPYFQGMTVNDILGQIWDQMNTAGRAGVTRNQFINDNLNISAQDWENYNNELLEIYYATHPEARNSGWTFNNNPYKTYANVNFGNAEALKNNKGNKTVNKEYFVNDPIYKKLSESDKGLEGNKFGEALEAIQEYKDYTDYLVKNWDSPYVRNWLGDMATRHSVAANNLVENINGEWQYKKDLSPSAIQKAIKKNREDATPSSANGANGNAAGLFHFTADPDINWTKRYWVKDKDGNYSQVVGGIADADEDKYIAINTSPYQVTVDNNNYSDYYYRLKTDADNATTTAGNESDYLTVGWKPKIDYTGLALGVAPGLTGLAMQLGRGAPDMSELDKAVAAYERNTGTMVAPHLTHGLIRPAIIDPRVTENSLNARRLGTNRLLMNTGSTPSRGATILANDANTIGQLGQAMINNWRENRQQEQAAAAFNRETNTTNANILNQVDQFNAQTQSALARDAAQLRYNVAKDKIAARDAYYAGLMGNLGSVFKGGYEAWRENQRKNERDLLAASGVFGETNSLIDDWLGISKVDPKTGKVVRGLNTGMYYWINPNTGKTEYLKTPPLATNPINACGGKIKKNKKRKGYTF